MALDTDTRKAERRRIKGPLVRSRIARLILASNLAGLLILVIGALVLNGMRAGLVQARMESLRTQGEIIASVMADVATRGSPEPSLEAGRARAFLKRLNLPESVRARLYNRQGRLVGDSWLLADQVDVSALPPLAEPPLWERVVTDAADGLSSIGELFEPGPPPGPARAANLEEEITRALMGAPAFGQRFSERGQRVVSVTVPVQRVSAVVGVLTVEASDVAEIVRAERLALMPFIGVAVIVAIMSSFLLTVTIARPLRRLAFAADRVRSGNSESIALPALSKRRDEIGDLAYAIETMTETLFNRIVANEQFAADVAHELKNPLTSIRSAIETADRVTDEGQRERLRKVIASDVVRLDRLITDISNASRLEAESARQPNQRVDLDALLNDLAETYGAIRNEGDPKVIYKSGADDIASLAVNGRESALGQVFRNLIENARSFSPPDGRVTLKAVADELERAVIVTVTDQGPGLPPDKLQKIFERFYTDRPAGTEFGQNSGLGLSIVRQIVESHHGSVRGENIVSEDGAIKGARFTVRLPGARHI